MALRASEGLAAVDFLMPGYFVWGKIIEALADVGYEPNNLVSRSDSPWDSWTDLALGCTLSCLIHHRRSTQQHTARAVPHTSCTRQALSDQHFQAPRLTVSASSCTGGRDV